MEKPEEPLKPQTLVNNVELKPKKKIFKKKCFSIVTNLVI